MNIQKYLENLKEIEKLQKENSDYLNSNEEEILSRCPFCVGDIITDNNTTVRIRDIRFYVNKDGEIEYRASGQSSFGFNIIIINNETRKIGEYTK